MAETEEIRRSDTMLKSLAETHERNIPLMLGTIAGFLARRTDFFTGGKEGQWQSILFTAFEKAEKAHREHKKQMAAKEMSESSKRLEAKQRREEELKKQSSAIYEVTDEEAAKLQKEIDAEKNKKNDTESAPKAEAPKQQDDKVDENDTSELKANKGYGCNLERYKWTQTKDDVEVKIPIGMNVGMRDVTVRVLKKSLYVCVKGKEPIIDGELHAQVLFEEITWQINEEIDGKTVVINFEKVKDNWWTQLMTTDPEIKINPPRKRNQSKKN